MDAFSKKVVNAEKSKSAENSKRVHTVELAEKKEEKLPLTASERKIERAVRVYSVFPKDKVIIALEKKQLTKAEKMIVLQRLGINPEKLSNNLLKQDETHETINAVSPSINIQIRSTKNTASSHKKSKKVKKAIKYFNGKEVSKTEVKKALEGEKFTNEEIEIVLSNI